MCNARIQKQTNRGGCEGGRGRERGRERETHRERERETRTHTQGETGRQEEGETDREGVGGGKFQVCGNMLNRYKTGNLSHTFDKTTYYIDYHSHKK